MEKPSLDPDAGSLLGRGGIVADKGKASIREKAKEMVVEEAEEDKLVRKSCLR